MSSYRGWRIIGSSLVLVAATAGAAGALKTGWLPSRLWGTPAAGPVVATAVLPNVSSTGLLAGAAAESAAGESPMSDGLWPLIIPEARGAAGGVGRRAARPGMESSALRSFSGTR